MSKFTAMCAFEYKNHLDEVRKGFCTLMNEQSVVDVMIRCGNKSVHVHKVIIAVGSKYLKNELSKNSSVQQIIVRGMDFEVLKAVIEFMYLGELLNEGPNLKQVVVAAKFLQMPSLVKTFASRPDLEMATFNIPPPQIEFLTAEPKYTVSDSLTWNANGKESVIYGIDKYFKHGKSKHSYQEVELQKILQKQLKAKNDAAIAYLNEMPSTSRGVPSVMQNDFRQRSSTGSGIPNVELVNTMQPPTVINIDELEYQILMSNPIATETSTSQNIELTDNGMLYEINGDSYLPIDGNMLEGFTGEGQILCQINQEDGIFANIADAEITGEYQQFEADETNIAEYDTGEMMQLDNEEGDVIEIPDENMQSVSYSEYNANDSG